MFSTIKGLLATLQSLVSAVETLGDYVGQWVALASESGVLQGRVEQLEASRATWETELQAELVLFGAKLEAEQARATSTYQSARNAEERTKKMKATYEASDEGDLESEADVLEAYRNLGWVPAGDANGSAADEVPPLHEVVGVGPKNSALRAKFSNLRGGP